MGAVFISYRRGDSEGQARALSLELVKLLGKDSVFMDVDSIALGRDFRQVLQERLASCDVMLALIGPGWLDSKDAAGTRRLESSTDYVRQEIAGALKRNIPVIPLLLQGAQVPPPERLPDDLQDLSYRNSFELGHSTWESDVREMVSRLGLGASKTADVRPAAPTVAGPRPEISRQAAPFLQPRVIGAAAALLVGILALVVYFSSTNKDDQAAGQTTQLSQPASGSTPPSSSQPSSGSTSAPSSQTSSNTAAPSRRRFETTPLPVPASNPGDRLTASGIEFVWPGGDCWEIFRGAEAITTLCGTAKQTLAAGTYTIKPRWSSVFTPFDVTIQSGTPTRISKGGVFEFAWPGEDCWEILRGAESVATQCGTTKQALGAGTYTIRGRWAAVFEPFTVDIKDGMSTRVAFGGVLSFKWPGEDCWEILRGTESVTTLCGAKKQTLGAGTYTIKGRWAAIFEPFDIKVVDGRETVKAP